MTSLNLAGLSLNLVGTIIVFVSATDFMKWVRSNVNAHELTDNAMQKTPPSSSVLSAYRERLLKKSEGRLTAGLSLIISGLCFQFIAVMFELMTNMAKR
ncbi:MAG: hypothetical protein HZA88_22580 [Verrucomicrobia bacterium]|nr:hypothetical protein [Verrucomicrobiota bacterium]